MRHRRRLARPGGALGIERRVGVVGDAVDVELDLEAAAACRSRPSASRASAALQHAARVERAPACRPRTTAAPRSQPVAGAHGSMPEARRVGQQQQVVGEAEAGQRVGRRRARTP